MIKMVSFSDLILINLTSSVKSEIAIINLCNNIDGTKIEWVWK